MGKNYLLETYLNGLQDVERKTESNRNNSNNSANDNKNDGGDNDEVDKEITTPGNSDSGVNTEDIATSPDIGSTSPLTNHSSSNSVDNNNDGIKKNATLMDATTALTNICKRLSIREKPPKKPIARKTNETKTKTKTKTSTTSREAKLIMEHANRMEFCEKMKKRIVTNDAAVANNPNDGKNGTNGISSQLPSKALNVNDHLAGQIELLEKVIAINKHIQHEEELLVRLNAKIHKYEFDDPNLTKTEMNRALEQINTNIESSTNELAKTEHEINESNEMLMNKAKLFKDLCKELDALEMSETKPNLIQVPSHQIQIHTTNSISYEPHVRPNSQSSAQMTQIPIHIPASNSNQPIQTDLEPAVIQSNQLANEENPRSQINVPLTNQSTTSKQMTLPLTCNLKTGTLPNLISSALKKTTQISAKNTYCGTIPKRLPQCNQITASNINRSIVTMAGPSNGKLLQCSENGTITTGTTATVCSSNNNNNNNSQTFIVPDHVILSQAPLFFQKDNFNGNFMQSIDQRNINSNPNTIYNNRNINNASSMANCGKIGPKILINGLYKDPDSDTGLSSMGDDGLHHIGTLV